MAISVKVMQRPEPGRTSYMRATLKGLSLTFKHLLKVDKVTLQYPEDQPDLHPRWRGTHRMEVHADGRPKCVACGLCPTVCPANCIRLVGGEDDQGNRYPIVLRDRRVPLHLLWHVPGGLPGRGDPCGAPLRERRIHPRPLRLRSRPPDGPGSPDDAALGSLRPPLRNDRSPLRALRVRVRGRRDRGHPEPHPRGQPPLHGGDAGCGGGNLHPLRGALPGARSR